MLEYIILIGIVIIIILLIISISKNINESNITERLGKLETTSVKEMSNFKIDIIKTMNEDFNNLNEMLEYRLTVINEKVNERLDENFAKTNKTFTNILERLSKIDVKKHIDAISTKYIIPGITSSQAIMFLPAEAIFAELNAYHTELIEYANKKRVWITSPTTLMSTLTVIQVILKNLERDKYSSIIHEELNKLGLEFSRYKERWNKLTRSIETVNKDIENINITTDKITKHFDSINQVEIKDKDYIE